MTRTHVIGFYASGIAITALSVLSFAFEVPYGPLLPVFILLCILCIKRPDWYLFLLSGLVPLSVQFDDIGGGLGLSLPTEPMIFILFALVVVRFFLVGSVNRTMLSHPLSWLILLHLIWYGITSLSSTMPLISLKAFIARTWFIVLFYYVLLYFFQSRKNIHYFLWAMIIGTLIMTSYTILRHAGEGFVRSHSYTIMRPFFRDHGIYAAAIAFFVPITLVYGFYYKSLRIPKALSWFAYTACGILLVGIVFSFTRATWLSIIAALAFLMLLQLRVRFVHLLMVLVVGILYATVNQDNLLYSLSQNKQGSADNLEDHVKSVSNVTTDPSNLERINRWKCALLMFADKPFLGFGPNTYTSQYGVYQKPGDLTIISTHAGTLGNAHSEYFSALSETGLLGFLIYIGIFLFSIQTGMKLYYKSSEIWIKAMALGVMSGLITYYFHGLLNNYTEYDKISAPLWGFLAILTALDLYHSPSKSDTLHNENEEQIRT